jgi:hypothetical protein
MEASQLVENPAGRPYRFRFKLQTTGQERMGLRRRSPTTNFADFPDLPEDPSRPKW